MSGLLSRLFPQRPKASPAWCDPAPPFFIPPRV